MRGGRPLDEQSQAALAEVVRAVKEHDARVNPYGGVLQELYAAVRLATHCIPDGAIRAGALGKRDGAEVRQRLKDAAAAVRTVLEKPRQVMVCAGCRSQRIVVRRSQAYCTEPDCDRRLPGPPCPECKRPLALHVCTTCSPDGLTAGPGCHNCRRTGWDQTSCRAEERNEVSRA